MQDTQDKELSFVIPTHRLREVGETIDGIPKRSDIHSQPSPKPSPLLSAHHQPSTVIWLMSRSGGARLKFL